MNKRYLIRLAIIALVAIFGYFGKDKMGGSKSNHSPNVENRHTNNSPKLKSDIKFDKSSSASGEFVMKNVTVKDYGKVVYKGDVDLKPTFARIKAGIKDSHRNDGSTFGNRERLLPQKSGGYYKEYVIRTKNIKKHAGPQRLIIGRDGEAYYTHDHYKSFTRVK